MGRVDQAAATRTQAIDGLKLEGDEKVGAQIVRRALEEPIRNIVENAGLEGTEALITDLPEEKPAAGPPTPHGDF